MAIQLNHTIVAARDRKASAEFLAGLLGLEVKAPYGPFLPVETDNGVSLDYHEAGQEPVTPQHYAFLVSDEEFDAIFGRIEAAAIGYYGGPGHQMPGQINTRDRGRGVYFDDPSGHVLEIITRPYGG